MSYVRQDSAGNPQAFEDAAQVSRSGPWQPLTALVEERVRLEDRLAELHRIATALGAAKAPANVTAQVAELKAAVARLDADLTRLANAVHDVIGAAGPALVSSNEPTIAQLLFVGCGDRQFALRLDSVREIRGWRGAIPQRAWRERDLNVIPLGTVLGIDAALPTRAATAKLIVLDSPLSTALLVDAVLRQDELLVYPTTPLVPGPFSGTAIATGGEPVLVLDTNRMPLEPETFDAKFIGPSSG